MKKTIRVLLISALIISPFSVAMGQQKVSCDDRLRQAVSILDITRDGRDRAESSLAELFIKYQDALKQIEDLKAKQSKEGN